MKLPRLPHELVLPAGRIRVVRKRGLQKREKAVGKCCWNTRTVTLDADLRGNSAWLTLLHERVHMVLFDAGVTLSEEHEERVCDAIAQDWVAEMVRKAQRA